MYTVFSQICMINKIRSFLFFLKKKKINITQFLFLIYIWEKNNSLTRVLNTRVQMDTCIKYTCPFGRVYLIHVSNCEDGTI
jgi:hypothetical protein